MDKLKMFLLTCRNAIMNICVDFSILSEVCANYLAIHVFSLPVAIQSIAWGCSEIEPLTLILDF